MRVGFLAEPWWRLVASHRYALRRLTGVGLVSGIRLMEGLYSRSAGVACALSILLLAGCGQEQQPAQAPPAATVATPTKRTIVDSDEYVGRFVAVDSVEVRARVSGYLDTVHFTDGQVVKQGDLLFTIDRRPFQNTLDQARANLATAK